MPISMTEMTQAASYLGAAIAMGFGAIGSGVGEGYTASKVTPGMARQPAVRNNLLKTMLIGQAISETPGIFALVIALMLVFANAPGSLAQAMALIGAGISVGVGAMGAGVGTGITSGDACETIARRPDSSQGVAMTMLLGQAFGTSPAVFGFVVSLLLLTANWSSNSIVKAAALLGAGISMGASGMGPGLGVGYVGARAAYCVGTNMRAADLMNRTLLLGGAVAQSTSIYALIVALLLMYFT